MAVQGLLGWVDKYPLSAGWRKKSQRRFLVLKGRTLSYYKSAEDGKPKGEVEINASSSVFLDAECPKPFTMGLKALDDETMFFGVEDQQQVDAWVHPHHLPPPSFPLHKPHT